MQFSVISFNIRFGLAADGTNGWTCRKDAVAALFDKYRPNFVGVQELNRFQTDFLLEILPEYDCVGIYEPAPDYWQDSAIFYRKTIECTGSQHFFLSETPSVRSRSWGSKWPRQCTMGRFTIGSNDLVCINTHFDFEEPAQFNSARLIWHKIRAECPDIPAVLMGDFNAEPQSKAYRWFTGKIDEGRSSTRPDFEETFKEPYPGSYHRFTGRPVAGLIDWILYRGRLRPKEPFVIEDSFDGLYPSDHFPVMACFEFV
ncbi:MAG: endonuclease/exonuclease/phosphatase family protein [Deltaproteobacteria bacterium]|jgi:endonuclease/exonuclease/phosphatase family metal-dependent hydrolase|nr:endonuclease/exonuclease/phosphatase family protein [Deltaproteobacteria bacterium]